MSTTLDQQCIDTLRFLSVDMVQKANSGHPGLPLGAAPMAFALVLRRNDDVSLRLDAMQAGRKRSTSRCERGYSAVGVPRCRPMGIRPDVAAYKVADVAEATQWSQVASSCQRVPARFFQRL